MIFEQLMKLVNAGFTKEDIAAFLQQSSAAPVPAPAPTPAPAPVPAPSPAPAPGGEFLEKLSQIAAQMEETAQKIQMANIRGSENRERTQEQIADDFLASIINPKTNV